MIVPHQDQKYVEALRNNDSILIKEIYLKCAANCIAYIKGNSGTETDAADVFQEALTEVILQCNELILTKSICNYLFTIYSRKWINKLNRRKNFVRILKDIGYCNSAENSQEVKAKEEKMQQIFITCFVQLGERCKDVLNMYNNGMTGQEIADKLGIKRNNVFKQKFDCLDRLKTLCEQHPDFKDLQP